MKTKKQDTLEKDKNTKQPLGGGGKITRKEAIKKTGITALTAASLFFLETKPAAAASLGGAGTSDSPAPPPGPTERPQS